ncbi:5-oxoprolinase subunit PxpB [Pseudooceanicola nanhaiensis]|uniref:5-oxoprolinase subunit PxpB n=1 Tax=Pseudooceanicola nanhaiensis TaxID=375761 RepID=UPI001CD774C6|nr:5-oxoprolinase subunit PxpB [Pseudooceanicola nanhaiensis]MCA0921560.1 5-oxoprolinase subunit PxpB [Pseudooceanicola nanhaiensis]
MTSTPPSTDAARQGPIILPLGDSAVSVEFGRSIDPDMNEAVIALAALLDAAPFDGFVEAVPTYRSLLVAYDPLVITGSEVEALLRDRLTGGDRPARPRRLWRIPVHYGGPAALDLEDLAREKDMEVAEVIALHSGADYRVYMIGFAPGFAYLGGLSAALHTPRLPVPRQLIPAGAIGIGGQQASVNSVPGPSGWRFIGETPVRAYDPARAAPFLFAAGDALRFTPISAEEAADLAARRDAGEEIITAEALQ